MAWTYKGTRFNFAHGVTYEEPGGVAELKSGEKQKVGGFLQLHPPLNSSLEPSIEIVYVPAQHNAFGPVAKLSEAVTVNRTLDLKIQQIIVADLTNNPDEWVRSLDKVYQFVTYDLSRNEKRYPGGKKVVGEWARTLLADYQMFLKLYANEKRKVPADPPFWATLSESEKEERRQKILERFKREPLWGQYIQRMWKNNVMHLQKLSNGKGN